MLLSWSDKTLRLTYVLNVDLTLMFNFCGDIWGWGERNEEWRERGDKREEGRARVSQPWQHLTAQSTRHFRAQARGVSWTRFIIMFFPLTFILLKYASASRSFLLYVDRKFVFFQNIETASVKQISICASLSSLPLLRFCSHPGLLGSMSQNFKRYFISLITNFPTCNNHSSSELA